MHSEDHADGRERKDQDIANDDPVFLFGLEVIDRVDENDCSRTEKHDVELFLFHEPGKIMLWICILGIKVDLVYHAHHPAFKRHDDK